MDVELCSLKTGGNISQPMAAWVICLRMRKSELIRPWINILSSCHSLMVLLPFKASQSSLASSAATAISSILLKSPWKTGASNWQSQLKSLIRQQIRTPKKHALLSASSFLLFISLHPRCFFFLSLPLNIKKIKKTKGECCSESDRRNPVRATEEAHPYRRWFFPFIRQKGNEHHWSVSISQFRLIFDLLIFCLLYLFFFITMKHLSFLVLSSFF